MPFAVRLAVALAALCTIAAPARVEEPSIKASGVGSACIRTTVAGEPRCLEPGDTFRDCETCPEMVVVPPGSFEMGSDEASDEGPVHTVTISRPFAIAKFETTFALWDECVADGACRQAPSDRHWGRDDRPVINVSWNHVAGEFLPWLSAKAGTEYRLPSEAEWEYAARAGSRTVYAWGDSIGSNRANCDGCGSAWDNQQTAPVGSFEPNAFGIHDMHGNVWEWTQDCFARYDQTPRDGSPWLAENCRTHAVRGGGWSDRSKYLRAAIRYGDTNDYYSTYVGFRVARTL